jgi:hypothetical protein
MRVDTNKIDERIAKLQEIKRIASDPELLRMLLEFIELDEDGSPRFDEEKLRIDSRSLATDDAGELIDHVMRAVPGTSYGSGRR